MYEKKILVASAHSIVRHGLRLMLNAATPHTVVGDGRPLAQMADMLLTHAPDIVIADVCGQPDELEHLLPVFFPAHDQPKLLLLWDLPESDARTAHAAQAAAGIITSRCEAMDVLDVVGRVASGRPSHDFPAVRAASPPPAVQRPGAHITPREQQIMELIRQGCCNKRIARALEISVTTVRTHRQKLMAKLGLHNAVEIARYAAGSAVGRSAF